jgi:hypothetical protein
MTSHKGSSALSLSFVQAKSAAVPCHGPERGHKEESFEREMLNIMNID